MQLFWKIFECLFSYACIYLYACMYPCTYGWYVCLCVRACVRVKVLVCWCVFVYVRVSVCVSKWMCVRTYVHSYIRTHVQVHACTYVYTHTPTVHTWIHACIQAYARIWKQVCKDLSYTNTCTQYNVRTCMYARACTYMHVRTYAWHSWMLNLHMYERMDGCVSSLFVRRCMTYEKLWMLSRYSLKTRIPVKPSHVQIAPNQNYNGPDNKCPQKNSTQWCPAWSRTQWPAFTHTSRCQVHTVLM